MPATDIRLTRSRDAAGNWWCGWGPSCWMSIWSSWLAGCRPNTVLAVAYDNLTATGVDELTAIIKNRLKSIQYRPALIDGFLAQTGLTLGPEPP